MHCRHEVLVKHAQHLTRGGQLHATDGRCGRLHALPDQAGLHALPDQAGEAEGDEIFYTDKRGGRDHECLSLGCDRAPVLEGRTPLQTYADFIAEFAAQCQASDLWGAAAAATPCAARHAQGDPAAPCRTFHHLRYFAGWAAAMMSTGLMGHVRGYEKCLYCCARPVPDLAQAAR